MRSKTLLSISAVQWKPSASVCVSAQQKSIILTIKIAGDQKAVVLIVLGLGLSEGCCPLLEGMTDLWSHLRASVPESGTQPSTMAWAFRTKACRVTNVVPEVGLQAADCNQIWGCAPKTRIRKFCDWLQWHSNSIPTFSSTKCAQVAVSSILGSGEIWRCISSPKCNAKKLLQNDSESLLSPVHGLVLIVPLALENQWNDSPYHLFVRNGLLQRMTPQKKYSREWNEGKVLSHGSELAEIFPV